MIFSAPLCRATCRYLLHIRFICSDVEFLHVAIPRLRHFIQTRSSFYCSLSSRDEYLLIYAVYRPSIKCWCFLPVSQAREVKLERDSQKITPLDFQRDGWFRFWLLFTLDSTTFRTSRIQCLLSDHNVIYCALWVRVHFKGRPLILQILTVYTITKFLAVVVIVILMLICATLMRRRRLLKDAKGCKDLTGYVVYRQ
jgi:hypothetical protein